MANQAQDDLIDAITEETTHLRAELNAVKTELRALRDDLHRIALAVNVAPSRAAIDVVERPSRYIPATIARGVGRMR